MEERINQKIIGQKAAVKCVCDTLIRAGAGLCDPARPLASFLFCGTTGVGKTELCRVLARELFGTSKALIKLDMAEFMEPHSIAKLIGSPPGYIGHENGGALCEKIRSRSVQHRAVRRDRESAPGGAQHPFRYTGRRSADGLARQNSRL